LGNGITHKRRGEVEMKQEAKKRDPDAPALEEHENGGGGETRGTNRKTRRNKNGDRL